VDRAYTRSRIPRAVVEMDRPGVGCGPAAMPGDTAPGTAPYLHY